MNWKTNLLACLLLASAGEMSAQESLELVRNGKAQATFLLPDNADDTEKLAAKEFTDYAGKITGARIPVAEKTPVGMVPIQLALSTSAELPAKVREAAKQLRYDGFLLDVSKDGLRIVSARKRGLLYGVYSLLREYGGVIWFHPDPTDEGEYVPKSPNFRVPFQLTVRNPEFEFRHFGLNGGSIRNDHVYTWFLRNGMQLFTGQTENPKLKALDPIYKEGGHDMTNLLVGYRGSSKDQKTAEQQLYRKHPEYFGLDSQGIRRIGGNNVPNAVQPCTSNPEVLKRMGDHALERIARFNGMENIRSLCNDDHTSWCQCENCKKLDDPSAPRGNRHAERWWRFVNYMAGRVLTPDHPENKLVTRVYQTYRFPPKTVKPDPRVTVTICPHQRCYLHPLTDPSCPSNATTFRRMFDEWSRLGMRADTFEYHTQMPGATRYLPMERAWVEDLRYYRKLNMAGYGFITRAALSDFGPRKSPFNDHMWMSLWQQHWLTAYYSWNINADFDKTSETINSKYYGPAWKFMKPYREELTKALYAPKIHMGYGKRNSALGRCGESAGLFDRLHTYLDQAEKTAAGDPLLRKRIGRDRLFLKLSWEDAYQEYKAAKQKEYNAKRVKGKLKIDGNLEEDAWNTANVISDFKLFREKNEDRSSSAASPQTFVRMLYDDHNLYLGIEAMKAKSGKIQDTASGDGIPAAMRGSHIEIFLTPPALKGKYQHLGFSHNGKRFEALTDSPSSRDEQYKTGFEYKISERPDRWIAEVRIPTGKLGGKIKDGETWKFNIARSATGEDGTQQSSSTCNGIFHGSEVYRTLAFGEAGAILKNGDFEDAAKPKLKKNPKLNWEYPNNLAPLHWTFNANNKGKAWLLSASAPSGKNVLRVEGVNAFFGQYLTVPPAVKQVSVSMQVRGKGEILTRLFGKTQSGFETKVDSADQWKTVRGSITVPEGTNAFWIRVTGLLDFDDVKILPEEEETMPDASKHQ